MSVAQYKIQVQYWSRASNQRLSSEFDDFKIASKHQLMIFIIYHHSMIEEKEQFQVCQRSEEDQPSHEILSEEQEHSLEEGFQNLSVLERYLSSDYQIFNRDELTLGQLFPIKNSTNLQEEKNAMMNYFCKKQKLEARGTEYSNQRGQISSQFVINLSNIPSHNIMYLSILSDEDNRFNMIARNSRGECLGYFLKQRRCKKIPKILKILSQVPKPMMAVIYDQSAETHANVPQIQKISDLASQFIYIFENADDICIRLESNLLRSEAAQNRGSNCSVQLTRSQLLICSPNLSTMTETEVVDILTDKIKTFELEQSNILGQARGIVPEHDRNLELEFIFINVWRIFQTSPQQTIVIIQRLFMQQQQNFHRRDQRQRQKEIDRQQNKDPNCHFPEKAQQSKFCQRCQNASKRRFKKTNIKCQGCSVIFKKDIYLCPLCFADFHERFQYYSARLKPRRLRRRLRSERIPEQNIIRDKNQQKVQQNSSANAEHSAPNLENKRENKSKYLEKVKKMDNLLTETFGIVNSLHGKGCQDALKLFLSAYLNVSLQKMHKIQTNYPELGGGITSFGSKVAQLLQKIPESQSKSSQPVGSRSSKQSSFVKKQQNSQ